MTKKSWPNHLPSLLRRNYHLLLFAGAGIPPRCYPRLK
ncbi:hypothetical protein CsSME_00053725 [Camellia sinensis var. sinensis]